MSPDLQFNVVLVGTAVVAAIWVVIRVRRLIRRRRQPAAIHPKLRKYQPEPGVDVVAERQREAAKILATSSSSVVTGYCVVRQIEAVFVDGFRRADEAVEGLKAVAAMKGANGVTNVTHTLTAGGKYSAHGDAVVLRPVEREESDGCDGRGA
jgi:hypothetical protein